MDTIIDFLERAWVIVWTALRSDPIHPMLVHFPIALFLAACLMEGTSLFLKKDAFHKTACHMFVFAALMTPLVVWTGLWEEARLRLNHPLFYLHKNFGFTILWGSLAALVVFFVFRKRFEHPSWMFLAMTGLFAGLVAATSFFGGVMVYEYGIGVAQP